MLKQGFGGAHLFTRRLQPTPDPVADPSPPAGSDPDDEEDDDDDESHTDPLDPGPPVLDSGDEDDDASVDADDTQSPSVPVLDEGDADEESSEEEDDPDVPDLAPSLPIPDSDSGEESDTVPDASTDPPSLPAPDPDPDDEDDDDDDVSHSDPLDPGIPIGPPVLDEGDDDDHLTSSESDDDLPPVTPTFETPLHTVYTFNGSQTASEWTGSATVTGSKLPINVEIGTDWTLMFDLKPGAPKLTDEYYLSITTPTYGEGLVFHSLYLSTVGAYTHNFRSKWVSKDFGLNEVPEWTDFQTVRIENDHTGTCMYRNGVEVASFSPGEVNYDKSHIFLGSMFLYEDGDGYAGKRTNGTQMRNIKFYNYLLSATQRTQLAQNQWYV